MANRPALDNFLQVSGSEARKAESELDTDVRFVKGVGEKLASILARLGIFTVRDLLTHYPLRYEDRTHFTPVARLQDSQRATLRLRVTDLEHRTAGRRQLPITRVAAEDDTGTLVLVWFNQPWIKERFQRLRGRTIIVFGQAKYGRLGFEMNTPSWELEDAEDSGDPWSHGKYVPVYALTDGINQSRMRRIILNCLDKYAVLLQEALPYPILEKYDLLDIENAIRSIHWSESDQENASARRRLVFEELFLMQVALAQLKYRNQAALQGISFQIPNGLLDEVEAHLPFSLTGAQKRVICEIWDDMRSPHPMNRLLQGDVGSGKTVVALAAALLASRCGWQTAIMAPTEVLAEQHYLSIIRLAEPLGLRSGLLSGGVKAKQRRLVNEGMQSGSLDVVVGTHALVQESVDFHKLGLVIIDEQHKFGVRQRSALRDKGSNPDVLVMTATPIPRTLTLTRFGDLDVSRLDEMPPGRKPVITHCRDLTRRYKVYQGVRTIIERGGQAYVVCPLVEESGRLEAKAATALAEDLAANVFPDLSVGLLHGQMSSEEKQAAIAAFRDGKYHILVCTTVVEVGVDIPNANVIVIENAERFGLAQLHQLRGRVGRSGNQAYCILLTDTANEETMERLLVLESTNDGFRVADEDMRLRGPGDFFGARQSGLTSLKIADPLKDVELLEQARDAAIRLIAKDPGLNDPKYGFLRKEVERLASTDELETSA